MSSHICEKQSLLLMIYAENKPSAEYVQEGGSKIKNPNDTYQNYIYQFRYKGNVLVESMRVSL
jgi:hypothetical protein